MYDLWIEDAVLQRQIIEEIKHVLNGSRQDRAAVHCTEYRLKQVVDILLQCAL